MFASNVGGGVIVGAGSIGGVGERSTASAFAPLGTVLPFLFLSYILPK